MAMQNEAHNMKCPNCDRVAKKVATKKYLGENWYYCTNPSCNMTAFQSREMNRLKPE